MIFLDSIAVSETKNSRYLLHIFIFQECLWEFWKWNTHQDCGEEWVTDLGCHLEFDLPARVTFLLKCLILIKLVCIYNSGAGIFLGLRHKLKPYSVSFNEGLCFSKFFTYIKRQHCIEWLLFLNQFQYFSSHSQLPFKRISY
jgi:hypothetical protein